LADPDVTSNWGGQGEMNAGEDEWFGGEHSGNDALQTRQNHILGRKERNHPFIKDATNSFCLSSSKLQVNSMQSFSTQLLTPDNHTLVPSRVTHCYPTSVQNYLLWITFFSPFISS
jgi:hypothetical protein